MSILSITVCITLLLIGFYVMLRQRANQASLGFLLLCVSVAFYVGSVNLAWISSDSARLFGFRLSHAAAGPMIASSLFLLVSLNTETAVLFRRWWFRGLLILFLCSAPLLASDLVVSGVTAAGKPQLAAMYFLFPAAALTGYALMATFWVLVVWAARRQSDSHAEFESSVIGGSVLLGGACIVTTNVVLTGIVGDGRFSPYGPGFTALGWISFQALLLRRPTTFLIAFRSLILEARAEKIAAQTGQAGTGSLAVLGSLEALEPHFSESEQPAPPQQVRAGPFALEIAPMGWISGSTALHETAPGEQALIEQPADEQWPAEFAEQPLLEALALCKQAYARGGVDELMRFMRAAIEIGRRHS